MNCGAPAQCPVVSLCGGCPKQKSIRAEIFRVIFPVVAPRAYKPLQLRQLGPKEETHGLMIPRSGKLLTRMGNGVGRMQHTRSQGI